MTEAHWLKRYDAAWKPLPGSTPVPLEHNTGCKWCVGEKPFVFCGLPTVAGRYCEQHEKMAVRVGEEDE